MIQSWVCNPWYEQTRFEGGYIYLLYVSMYNVCLYVSALEWTLPTPTVVCRNNRCSYQSPLLLSLTKWPTENAGSDQSLVIAESNSVFSAIPSTLLTVVYMCITWMWTYMYAPIGSNGCHCSVRLIHVHHHSSLLLCFFWLFYWYPICFNLITHCYVIIH